MRSDFKPRKDSSKSIKNKPLSEKETRHQKLLEMQESSMLIENSYLIDKRTPLKW